MGYKIVYYTRTGNSKRIAEKISKVIEGEVIQITDQMNWTGFFGYMKAGYYSTKDKPVKIEVHGEIKKDDTIILVAPLWAGGIAPACRSFSKQYSFERINLVVSSLGSKYEDNRFASLFNIINKNKDEDEVIKEVRLIMKK